MFMLGKVDNSKLKKEIEDFFNESRARNMIYFFTLPPHWENPNASN